MEWVSEEWVNDNEEIVNKVKIGAKNMDSKKIDFINIIKENYDDLKEAIFEHFKTYVLSPKCYDLFLCVDDDGTVSTECLSSHYRNAVFDKNKLLMFSCGGKNMTVWDLLKPVTFLLDNEDRIDFIENISNERNIDVNNVTTLDIQNYVQDNYPNWINEWLEDYFYDDYGYVDDYTERILDNLISVLEEYDTDED